MFICEHVYLHKYMHTSGHIIRECVAHIHIIERFTTYIHVNGRVTAHI